MSVTKSAIPVLAIAVRAQYRYGKFSPNLRAKRAADGQKLTNSAHFTAIVTAQGHQIRYVCRSCETFQSKISGIVEFCLLILPILLYIDIKIGLVEQQPAVQFSKRELLHTGTRRTPAGVSQVGVGHRCGHLSSNLLKSG